MLLLQHRLGTVVAHVVEVTVTDGSVKVDRVVTAVDCGIAVTPDVVRAQMQSCIGYGLSAALYGKISLTDGRVDQTNWKAPLAVYLTLAPECWLSASGSVAPLPLTHLEVLVAAQPDGSAVRSAVP